MGDIAVRVDNLSKLYRIGSSPANRTFREMLTDGLTAPFRRAGKNHNGRKKEFWALKDVSFEVKCGEVVGVIGRNGAGKSTLLKILSQITEPTGGFAEIHGRVGSLLEVGTGFHPELTGRENIYLNGAILGMKRREIDRKFDEIVDFAEVEQFIDTPVKHYSSGMYVRLAFAVAAHLEPEILIVDEVLAVGDAAFQKKCLGKMGDVAREGRTVLFVSHDVAAVQNLCERVVYLSQGRVERDSKTRDAIDAYLGSLNMRAASRDLKRISRQRGYVPIIADLEIIGRDGSSVEVVRTGQPLTLSLHYEHFEPLAEPFFGLRFVTSNGVNAFVLDTRVYGACWDRLPATGTLTCHIPSLPLVPGTYLISPSCGARNIPLDLVEGARSVHVVYDDYFGTGKLPDAVNGFVIVDADWTVNPNSIPGESNLEATAFSLILNTLNSDA